MTGSVGERADTLLRSGVKGFYGVVNSALRYAVRSDVVYQYYSDSINRVSRRLVPQFHSRVSEDDWKYLVVLDACRFDAFRMQADFDGTLQKSNSCSGWTKEWAIRNFSQGDWSDTLYISGSAWVGETEKWLDGNPFHSVEEVWEYGWDEDEGTVPPKEVRKAATRAIANNLEKRAVIHFQQPHTPLVGETSLRREEFDGDGSVYEAMRRGEVSREAVWEAYISNLDRVLAEVEQLLDVLDETVVITADHGECFGEFNLFEHPGALVPPIIEVPWQTLEKERDVDPADLDIDGEIEAADDLSPGERDELRNERLRQLGYLE